MIKGGDEMKRFFKIIPIITILMLTLTFAACKGHNPLIGTWQDSNDTIEFNKDGTYTSNYYFGMGIQDSKYTVEGKSVTFAVPMLGNKKYQFEIKKDNLYLKQGGEIKHEFKKVKK